MTQTRPAARKLTRRSTGNTRRSGVAAARCVEAVAACRRAWCSAVMTDGNDSQSKPTSFGVRTISHDHRHLWFRGGRRPWCRSKPSSTSTWHRRALGGRSRPTVACRVARPTAAEPPVLLGDLVKADVAASATFRESDHVAPFDTGLLNGVGVTRAGVDAVLTDARVAPRQFARHQVGREHGAVAVNCPDALKRL